MTDSDHKSMNFLYGDRELWLVVQDILGAGTEVIVNPANSGLSHGGGLAAQILAAAGEQLQAESEQLIREYGTIDSGMAVYTSAGQLDYKAVIHAVGPCMGEGDEQRKIEQAVSRSLVLCDTNDWQSIAFPAISTGIFNVPVETCARAFHRAITRFWDARAECSVEKIMLCLTEKHMLPFFHAFRDQAFEPEESPSSLPAEKTTKELPTGVVELNDADIAALQDDEINDWFK